MIAATAMCAAAATEVAAQDGSTGCVSGDATVCNTQTYQGDVIASLNLNVTIDNVTVEVVPTDGGSYEVTDGQITAAASAAGNTLLTGVQNGALAVRSTQTLSGNVGASTTMILNGDTQGAVNSTTQANGNYVAGVAENGELDVDLVQTVTGGEITAQSSIPGGTARLLQGAVVGVAASANTTALGGSGSGLTGVVTQTSDASVRAGNLAETQYLPATSVFDSQALGNAVAVTSDAASNQNLSIVQRSTGDVVEATTSANAGNAWDLAGRATAAGNQAVMVNQGGSVVVGTNQTNASQINSTAIVTAYDFGAVSAAAQGSGNAVSAGNNDRYLEIDNTQINSGGVEVQASFSGANGYDAYVSADAVGNSVTGYACSTCEGVLNATNVQTNSGNVTATANTAVYGSGRAVITGTNAVGNAATFYVSRPGQ